MIWPLSKLFARRRTTKQEDTAKMVADLVALNAARQRNTTEAIFDRLVEMERLRNLR